MRYFYYYCYHAAILVFSLCVGMPVCAADADVVLVDFRKAESPVPEGWKLTTNIGNPDLQLVPESDGTVLQLRSDKTSFALQKKFDIPLQDTPVLVWQWKVTTLPTGGDFRRSQTDDQAAQLIVAFSANRFLSYIWDTTAPEGTVDKAPAPPFRTLFALVVQAGRQALGTWLTERRNLLEDYAKVYGEPATMIKGVRIQINSQHTQSQAESYWKSIVLTAQP